MKNEITAAVSFLTRLIGKNESLNSAQIAMFEARLSAVLVERFENHWFPDQPCKGQGYRCIRLNESDRRDPVLEKAAKDAGLKYEQLQLPIELTVWVDPAEVCCRFGEHKGSYCTVASFKNGSIRENNVVNVVNVEKFEQKSKEQALKSAEAINDKNSGPHKRLTPKNKLNDNMPNSKHQIFYRHHPPPPHSPQPASSRGTPSPASSKSYLRLNRPLSNTTTNNAVWSTSQNCSVRNDRYHWVNKNR